jgi:hypothetical protein
MSERFGLGRVPRGAHVAVLAAAALLALASVASAAHAARKAPVNTSPPAIAGDAVVGKTVSGDSGTWTGAKSYSFVWLRCNANGGGCTAIPGATSANYLVTKTDANRSIRFRVTASNNAGSTSAKSAAEVVRSSPGTGNSVPVTSLTARPDHLLIPQVRFSPSPFGNPGGQLTVEVKVTLEGTPKVVSGALVYIVPVPNTWAKASAEEPTASDGWVAIKIQTTKSLPRKGSLVMQIRARGPGNTQEDILGGISTRRLVQVSLK